MNGDKLTRWAAVASVLAVAVVAGWVSYRHAVDVVSVHGEPGALGHWYPVTIDGLIIASSMVLLDAARHRESAPRLAWVLLGAGIGATLAANVLAGVPSGWLGALAAAWPALAFVGCYELLMMLVRASARRSRRELAETEMRQLAAETAAEIDAMPAEPVPGSEVVPIDSQSAALLALRATLAAGNPLSGRQLEARFGLTRAAATKVRQLVLAESNGASHDA